MLRKLKTTGLTLALTALCAGTVQAHSLWVNINESFAHPPGHVITSLGWGHVMPLDDFLSSESGNIEIEKYSLIGPDNSISPIPLRPCPAPTRWLPNPRPPILPDMWMPTANTRWSPNPWTK